MLRNKDKQLALKLGVVIFYYLQLFGGAIDIW